MNVVAGAFPDFVTEDLSRIGLQPEDCGVRVIDNAERGACNVSYSTQGYAIPYFSPQGRLLSFYRCRLFGGGEEFASPKDTSAHVFFPRAFHALFVVHSYVLVCTDELSALALVKQGFPACAIQGPKGWRNHVFTIHNNSKLSQQENRLAIQMPPHAETYEDFSIDLAVGLEELIGLCVAFKKTIVVAFDTDTASEGVHIEAQKHCAQLGYELRYRGIPFHQIKQLILPCLKGDYAHPRVTPGDFLKIRGATQLELMVTEVRGRSAFPRHPNVREYINARLVLGKLLSRKQLQEVALCVLSDMDSRGRRLKDLSNLGYFFDRDTKQLFKADWSFGRQSNFESRLLQFMYTHYGIGISDREMLAWLGTQFFAEQPIESVSPYRVFARPDREVEEDAVYYQLSDSQYARISAKGLTIHDNGDQNILFESDQVEPLDIQLLQKEYAQQQAAAPRELPCWWATTLSQVRLRDKDKQRVVAALLYYMSPWLFRWRGMQLPVELIVGESGSGKSTLCELRLDILTGRPLLRNTPTDLKDWHASVSSTGGLHVTDNVQLVDKTLRQRLSDEICRIVTEPDPYIEQRRYYTNADLIRMPVRSVFALTAIQQPFQNADLLQRAFILELDKSLGDVTQAANIRYDSSWKTRQLEVRGGREGWVAHHFVVLQRFFALVGEQWNDSYQAKQRLINFEQTILLVAKVFNIPSTWIGDFLVTSSDRATTEADWILEGLLCFAQQHSGQQGLANKRFAVNTISEWCETQGDFKDCEMLVNPRKLGRYMRAHKSQIYGLTSIKEAGLTGNKVAYAFDTRRNLANPSVS